MFRILCSGIKGRIEPKETKACTQLVEILRFSVVISEILCRYFHRAMCIEILCKVHISSAEFIAMAREDKVVTVQNECKRQETLPVQWLKCILCINSVTVIIIY